MIRAASLEDIDQLIAIENSCFDSDRISRRGFRHMLTKGNAAILVADVDNVIKGYVLVLFHRGTSLARLYSIAVQKSQRGSGIAKDLVKAAEAAAVERDNITMRLEIRDDNIASIRLFEHMGYLQFGRYLKYYEDEADAVRLEKRLVNNLPASLTTVPYYQQTLDFTCGPASLMMAMKTLNRKIELTRKLELRLWRESTTIYMTSGHGGCGPYGLALAAEHRGFSVGLFVKKGETLFIDSVRSEEKKEVIRLVEQDFLEEINSSNIAVHNHRLSTAEIISALDSGAVPVILISSYRIYNEKFPHWVVVTGHDDRFIYFHDPYVDEEKGKTITDCVNMPIPKKEFERMSQYGKTGQHAALILYPNQRGTKH
ncbi:peptidase C39 family protein [Kaarinaea lacus]